MLGAPVVADLPRAPGEISRLGMRSQHRPLDIVSLTKPIHHLPRKMLILLQTVSQPRGTPVRPEGMVDVLTTLPSWPFTVSLCSTAQRPNIICYNCWCDYCSFLSHTQNGKPGAHHPSKSNTIFLDINVGLHGDRKVGVNINMEQTIELMVFRGENQFGFCFSFKNGVLPERQRVQTLEYINKCDFLSNIWLKYCSKHNK